MKLFPAFAYFVLGLLVLTSCHTSRYALFQAEGSVDRAVFLAMLKEAEANYKIAHFDYITIELFTKKGEIILDPEWELINYNQLQIVNPAMQQGGNMNMMGGGIGAGGIRQIRSYMVHDNDSVYLPLVGAITAKGAKVYEIDSLLSKKFQKYYKDSYVVTKLSNRRVIVMGGLGNKIIPLQYESMHLLEILTLAGSDLEGMVKTNKIKIIRNVLTNPIMQEIDLTDWNNTRSLNLRIEPNDIIYIEPRRKATQNTIQDVNTALSAITSLVSIVSSFITTYFIIQRL